MTHQDILQLGLDLWKAVGEYMHYSSKKLYLYRTVNITIFVFTLCFIFLNLGYAQGGKFIETIGGGTTVFHIFLKYLMFIYYKSDIEELLDDRNKFWDYRISGNENFQKIKTTFKYVKLAQRSMVLAIIISITMHWLRPYFNENKRFVFECWIYSDSIILETSILILQCYILTMTLPVVVGYDCIYFSYSIHAIFQIKLLNYKLKYIDLKTNIEDVNCYVEQHNFLLSLCKRFNAIYFWMFLFHYFITLATSCTQMYLLFLGNVEAVEPIIYTTAVFAEFGYYSFPAEEIVNQLRDVSKAIYLSSWYRNNAGVQKMLLQMMMKAQQQNYMVAGGVTDMNVDVFGSFSGIVSAIYMSSWYEKDMATKRILLNVMTIAQVPKYLYAGGMIQVNIDTFGSVFRKSFSLYLVLKNLVK